MFKKFVLLSRFHKNDAVMVSLRKYHKSELLQCHPVLVCGTRRTVRKYRKRYLAQNT